LEGKKFGGGGSTVHEDIPWLRERLLEVQASPKSAGKKRLNWGRCRITGGDKGTRKKKNDQVAPRREGGCPGN